MANSLQARKRARQADKRRTHNQGRRSMMRTSLKKALAAIESGNREEAEALYKSASSALDIAAKNGLIHRNKAARHKSRMNAQIRVM
ncbi:MAG: 30S ribosomal protein S20 [Gammaproteobacteria bacterium]|nr:30S ribosomal protein S20 [Gammaproteobacteria bacterium]MBT3489760.1 30S ribosomal protein S20 [Gammaproteobacteria bacterium]MBT3719721.1 30S ribosomal protein S20 [Gammaproteobacteria bacterium]MBT3845495.1 30S ribosomal protein S20 [Gammaproteobacteria bacterium]MBT3892898.1 30S ribosomal protein S20 [Gammaproteobacteria bacterium]